MKNILLTTDFSENARNAALYAIYLFGTKGIRYTYLNVLDAKMKSELLPAQEDDLRAVSMLQLNYEINFLRESFPEKKIIIQPFVKIDNVPNAISFLNNKVAFDYVIAGTTSENKKNWFLGSNAKKISQNSPIPVLLIPGMATFENISSILFLTDLRLDESFLINQAIKFARLNKASITILHIDQDESESNSSALKLMELKVKSKYNLIKFEKVTDANVEEAIINYVLNNKVDLISVITYTTTLFKKWFHLSLTEKLSKHSTIPLLVYNRKEFDVVFLG